MSTQEGNVRQLVVTKIGDILCGIEIDAVHEIIQVQKITPVAKSPRNMLGVTNVRGAVIPVADLKACLGFPPSQLTDDTRIVLVSYREGKIGLLVDAVAEVITLTTDVFQDTKGSAGESKFLRSVARLDDRLILALDHERVIDDGLDAEMPDVASYLEALDTEPEEAGAQAADGAELAA